MFTRGSGAEPALDLETVFELLTDRRRRLVLRYLDEQTVGPAEFDDIVRYVLAWEEELGRGGPGHRRNVEVSMVHVHLPKLAEASVVEYDDPRTTISYSRSPPLEQFLHLAIEQGSIP